MFIHLRPALCVFKSRQWSQAEPMVPSPPPGFGSGLSEQLLILQPFSQGASHVSGGVLHLPSRPDGSVQRAVQGAEPVNGQRASCPSLPLHGASSTGGCLCDAARRRDDRCRVQQELRWTHCHALQRWRRFFSCKVAAGSVRGPGRSAREMRIGFSACERFPASTVSTAKTARGGMAGTAAAVNQLGLCSPAVDGGCVGPAAVCRCLRLRRSLWS